MYNIFLTSLQCPIHLFLATLVINSKMRIGFVKPFIFKCNFKSINLPLLNLLEKNVMRSEILWTLKWNFVRWGIVRIGHFINIL